MKSGNLNKSKIGQILHTNSVQFYSTALTKEYEKTDKIGKDSN